MKVDLGIKTRWWGPYLRRCVEGLFAVDAGVEYRLILNPTDQSHAKNVNMLIDSGDSEYLCLLEDDAFPISPGWLRAMVDVMDAYPDVGIVGPLEIKSTGMPEPWWWWAEEEVCNIGCSWGFCILLRRSSGVRADEAIPNGYFVDWDMTNQAKYLGWKVAFTSKSRVYHDTEPMFDWFEKRMSRDMSGKEQQSVQDLFYLCDRWSGFGCWMESTLRPKEVLVYPRLSYDFSPRSVVEIDRGILGPNAEVYRTGALIIEKEAA